MPKNPEIKKVLMIGSVRLSSARQQNLTMQEHRHAVL